ncbi:hypothetical protein [Rhizobium grahamii]|uniref:Uncharacterized protein n=1 Tax=Rhizobium grahamii CCGE 502 TaxID=990285 RepID=S3HMU5_9HYPH|nr:hypothetical protein [Rhizobium grahamii]EPE99395.1 hypothetical protein RGCCGE502_04400 [Rhizobium grahamii CCGE 502]
MITTLTILSLDQGRIYSPPPEPVADLAPDESEAGVAAVGHVTKQHLRWLNASTGWQALARLLVPTFGSTPFGKAH